MDWRRHYLNSCIFLPPSAVGRGRRSVRQGEECDCPHVSARNLHGLALGLHRHHAHRRHRPHHLLQIRQERRLGLANLSGEWLLILDDFFCFVFRLFVFFIV